MAVVVLPTPPFWLAIAMTMSGTCRSRWGTEPILGVPLGPVKQRALHLVAQIVRIQAFEPALKPLLVGFFGVEIPCSRQLQDFRVHEDRGLRPNRERQRVA